MNRGSVWGQIDEIGGESDLADERCRQRLALRQQPDGEDGWAMAFKAIVEDISLVRVNSAMVERLWSLYNARHKSSGHTFGPGERERVVKKRFNEVYRSGGL
jgi:hypothetical protein